MKDEEKKIKKLYDFMAKDYHELRTKKYPQGWFYNEMLEMPATFKLLGNVKGKKILDLGCGSGIYAKILTRKGAVVKGFDISPEMIKIARKENPKLDLRLGSGYKIPFKEKFDVVLASLVIHYFSDLDKVFKQDGIFIFSTGNPVAECRKKVKWKGKEFRVFDNYFRNRKIYGTWNNIKIGKVKVFSYHFTYEILIKAIIKNGFEIMDYIDCYPIKKAKKLFPGDYRTCSKIPYFSAWKLKKK